MKSYKRKSELLHSASKVANRIVAGKGNASLNMMLEMYVIMIERL